MFYRPQDGAPLPHSPFTAIVSPRPIAWISTRGSQGDNLSPYSFFNAAAAQPPQIMFASLGSKDTLTNIRETGVFAINIVSHELAARMNKTSSVVDSHIDEFEFSNIEKADCQIIDCPRAAESPATLECKSLQIITLAGKENYVVIGEVVGVHLRDEYILDGRFDVTRFAPLTRLGYKDFAITTSVFELPEE